jgi:hypothetical protein
LRRLLAHDAHGFVHAAHAPDDEDGWNETKEQQAEAQRAEGQGNHPLRKDDLSHLADLALLFGLRSQHLWSNVPWWRHVANGMKTPSAAAYMRITLAQAKLNIPFG